MTRHPTPSAPSSLPTAPAPSLGADPPSPHGTEEVPDEKVSSSPDSVVGVSSFSDAERSAGLYMLRQVKDDPDLMIGVRLRLYNSYSTKTRHEVKCIEVRPGGYDFKIVEERKFSSSHLYRGLEYLLSEDMVRSLGMHGDGWELYRPI